MEEFELVGGRIERFEDKTTEKFEGRDDNIYLAFDRLIKETHILGERIGEFHTRLRPVLRSPEGEDLDTVKGEGDQPLTGSELRQNIEVLVNKQKILNESLRVLYKNLDL